MSTFAAPLTSETVRRLLHAFWQESLEIAQTRQGLSLALPQTYPDGWQIVVDLEDHLPAGLKATDQGRTLGWLVAHGQNIETEAVERHLDEICAECGMERDGLELFVWFSKGFAGVDLHIFAEALVAIAHLHYLSDLKPRTLDIPDEMLQRVFKDHGVIALPGTTLDGRTRKKVKLDYFIADESPIAFQIIRRHGRILGTMEQWGFRWNDLRAAHPKLRPAMIYDPQHQEIDPDSRAIGEDVCDLFCSYEETDRIHEFLGAPPH